MTRHRSVWIPILAVFVFIATAFVPVAPAAAPDQRAGGTGTTTGTATGGARAPAEGRASAPKSTTTGRRGQPPHEKSPAGIALAAANERIKRINKAVAALDKAVARTMPKNLSAAEQQQWSNLGLWITSTKGRYAQHAQALTNATHTEGDEMALLDALSKLDEPFLILQGTVQDEAAKFTDLGKSAKSRHEAAVSALKGIK